MSYNFELIRENISRITKELKDNPYYNGNMKEYEQNRASYKLMEEIEKYEGFNDLLKDKMIYLDLFLYTFNEIQFLDKIIENTIKYDIDNTIEKLNSLFNLEDTKFCLYFMLLGIKINKRYDIDEKFKLISIAEEDNIQLESNSKLSAQKVKKNLINERFKINTAIVLTDNIKIIPNIDHNKAFAMNSLIKEKARIITLLISLLTKEACSILYTFPEFDTEGIIYESLCTGLNEYNFIPGEKVDIEIDIEEFTSMIKKIEILNKKEKNHLILVLSKFADACMVKDYMSKSIELRTVSEALFAVDRDYSDPISYLVRQRGAFFLGENAEERLKIDKCLNCGYKISSSIIHGSYICKNIEKDIEIVEEFKDICSKAIIKFIKSGKFYTKDDWDNLIYGINNLDTFL